MPARKVSQPQAIAQVIETLPPPPPSPIIQQLRKDWRWAGISQFLWTFSDAFGLIDWDIEALENDIDGEETALIPDILAKLLYALTYNRQINRDNVFEHLRKQYLQRRADDSPFGTLEEPVEWAALGLGQKVQTLWELCEWQLSDAAKFRALLPSEEEATSWRIDPIGWDKAGNTYFLFDDNRLWIQRTPPLPPRPQKKTSLKAKRNLKKSRPSTSSQPKKPKRKATPDSLPTPPPKPKVEEPVSGPRKRQQVQFYGNLTPTVAALKRGNQKETPPSTRGTRSSTRINGDAPASGSGSAGPSKLANSASSRTPTKAGKGKESPLPLGTRVSRRLRNVDDDWQQVPEEWLEGDAKPSRGGKRGGKRKEIVEDEMDVDDGDSELSELTNEDEHEAKLRASQEQRSSPAHMDVDEKAEEDDDRLTPLSDSSKASQPNGHVTSKEEAEPAEGQEVDAKDEQDDPEPEGDSKPDEAEEADEVQEAVKEASDLPEGFVEWEAVCVTLYDWRYFPEQFAKSRDPDEKALYSMLTEQVGPTVIEALVAKEQERLKQEAINNRKRSSRILARDLEREEQAKREKAQREMEERMERQRKEEQRAAREEAELLAREKAREDRLREREERIAAREGAIAAKAAAEQEAKDRADRDRESRKRRRELGLDPDDASSTGGGSRGVTPKAQSANGESERWELNCEVCRKTGWNIDGDDDLVCCDDCNRWQHVECHNRQDAAEGRPIRNWDQVDFRCKECRRKAARKRQRMEEEARGHHQQPVGYPMAQQAQANGAAQYPIVYQPLNARPPPQHHAYYNQTAGGPARPGYPMQGASNGHVAYPHQTPAAMPNLTPEEHHRRQMQRQNEELQRQQQYQWQMQQAQMQRQQQAQHGQQSPHGYPSAQAPAGPPRPYQQLPYSPNHAPAPIQPMHRPAQNGHPQSSPHAQMTSPYRPAQSISPNPPHHSPQPTHGFNPSPAQPYRPQPVHGAVPHMSGHPFAPQQRPPQQIPPQHYQPHQHHQQQPQMVRPPHAGYGNQPFPSPVHPAARPQTAQMPQVHSQQPPQHHSTPQMAPGPPRPTAPAQQQHASPQHQQSAPARPPVPSPHPPALPHLQSSAVARPASHSQNPQPTPALPRPQPVTPSATVQPPAQANGAKSPVPHPSLSGHGGIRDLLNGSDQPVKTSLSPEASRDKPPTPSDGH